MDKELMNIDNKESNPLEVGKQFKDSVDQNINLNKNQNERYVNVVPDFSKEELDSVEIHSSIAKEIRMEKYKLTLSILLSIIVLFLSTFFLALYFATKDVALGINKSSMPHPGITITGIALPIIVIIVNLIRLSHLTSDIKRYRAELIMGRERIPLFLLNTYKKIIKNYIYLNWICITIYLYSSIIAGVLFGINQAIKSPNINTTVIICLVILGVTIVFHILALIFNYKRKGNIDAYYGYEIVTIEQQLLLRKEANKFCMIFFFTILLIIGFVITIPILLVRKKQNKKLLWFI
ncbi:MSC_0882 family membrane protein [Mesoplasma corruscae]|uniref:Uncharacterized protein n=1 Tax=Mesoplasma corruscae TaxID=216874 RepID=A0A2S5RG67_9MOLU|nr:hypothetical protein [Mesoplasma corruscae]PPE06303.1 hypothetical protein MCORR_v1c06080 [Mesoplasma corruscae]